MADLTFPLVNTLAALWHIGAWGFSIVLAALWVWELSVSRQSAKAEKSLQDWSSQTYSSNLSRLEASYMEIGNSAKVSSDILSRISPRVAQRHGH